MKLAVRKLGSGKPLFILHGLFGSSDNWQTLAKQFGEYFTVYLIDLRNHGHSPHSDEFSYKAMSEDLLELMADEGLDKTTLLGHSMGGKVALQFTVDHQEKVEKLIVVDIGIKKYPATNQYVVDALEKFSPENLASRKEAEQILVQYIEDVGTRQFLLKNLYWDDNQKLQWRFNLEAIKNNLKNVGEATPAPSAPIELPVLFLKGERSDYIFNGDMRLINAAFPNAKLETIPGAGHWVHADQPMAFFKAIMSFLVPDVQLV
jgi:pimeloyl-ACP methyl ester carboxylesterase